MALINCPSCGKKISNRANICPHCGSAIDGSLNNRMMMPSVFRKSSKKKLTAIVALSAIVVTGIGGWLYYKNVQQKQVAALEKLLTQGLNAFDNEDWETAYKNLHEYRTTADSLNINIDNKKMGEAAYCEGCSAYSLELVEDAYAAFQISVSLGYKNDKLKLLKDECVFYIINRSDNYAEANDFVSKLLKEEPSNDTYNLGKAIALDRSGNFDNALEYYKKAIELNPTDPTKYQLLGMSLSLKAASDYENGSISIAKERYTQALQNFQKAMELLKNGDDPSLSSTSAGIIQLFINSIESRLSLIQ